MAVPKGDAQFDDTGDAAKARILRRSLERLAAGAAGAELRDMARDVLDGKTSLRQAMFSPSYTEALSSRVRSFAHWFRSLPDDERREFLERGQRHAEEITPAEDGIASTPDDSSDTTSDDDTPPLMKDAW